MTPIRKSMTPTSIAIFSPDRKEKHRKFVHHPRDRPVVVTVDAAEGFAGMRVGEVEPMRLRRWEGQGAECVRQRGRAGDDRQKKPSIHFPRLSVISPEAFGSAMLRDKPPRDKASQNATVYIRNHRSLECGKAQSLR